MGRVFTNPQDLASAIETEINKAMGIVGEKLHDLVHDYIKQYWYDRYNPIEYDRSKDFLDRAPILIKHDPKGGLFGVAVILDANQLERSRYTGLSSKKTRYRHNGDRDELIHDMMYGDFDRGGDEDGNGIVEGIDITQEIINDFFSNGEYVRLFANELKSVGLTLTKG